LLLSYSKAQTVQTVNPNTGVVSSTGNLINPTGWNGITYTNNAGVSQCCWGGPAPAMNQDTNTIRFSWGYSTASQIIGINTALANAGSGIKLNGYNYSWIIDNEGATQGTLTGNVSLQGANGQTLESYSYNYNNTNINLQTFSGTQNFTTNYSLSSVSSLDVSFTGKDNRFWAGYYGPRVRDVNVSLNYSSSPSSTGTSTTTPTVPTTTNSSSNNVTVSQTGQTTVTTSSTAVTPPTGQTSSNPTMTSVTSVNAGGANVSNTGDVTPQTGVPQAVLDSQASGSSSAPPAQQDSIQQNSSPTVSITAPSPGQPNIPGPANNGPSQSSISSQTASSSKSGPSPTAMAVVKQAQARDQATQKAVLQKSQDNLNASVAQSQQTATTAIASINANNVANSQTTPTPASSSTSVANIGTGPVQQSSTSSTTQQSQQTSMMPMGPTPVATTKSNSSSSTGFFGLNPMSPSGQGITVSMPPPAVIQQPTTVNTQARTFMATNIDTSFSQSGFGGFKASNPLGDAMSTKINFNALTTESKTDTVNKNVQQNDLAGSVTIAAIAVQPKGFDSYSVTLKDAPFYESREVYRNQTTVDNVRALRQLASDRVYQQMLDMQYKIGE